MKKKNPKHKDPFKTEKHQCTKKFSTMQRKTMMHTKKVDPAVKLLQQVKFDVLKTSI